MKSALIRHKNIIVFLVISAILAGCASQPTPEASTYPGNLMGLVHGFCIVFSLIGSIFTDVRVYAFPNAGGWYDLGYVIGASMFLGGGGASASS